MRVIIEFDPTTAQARVTGAALPETEATQLGTTVPVAAANDAGACKALSPSGEPLADVAGVRQRPEFPEGSPPPPHPDTFGLLRVVGGTEQAVDAGPFRR